MVDCTSLNDTIQKYLLLAHASVKTIFWKISYDVICPKMCISFWYCLPRSMYTYGIFAFVS